MFQRQDILQSFTPLQFKIIGILLIALGGVTYALFGLFFSNQALILLVSGVMLFLQTSRGFCVTGNARFFLSLFVANVVVVLIDFWPLQLVYAQAANVVLYLCGIPGRQRLQPYFGGLHVVLLVPEADSGWLIGGEIDNACAGLIVLVPSLILTIFSDKDPPPPPNRALLSLLIFVIVIVGNFFRILFELWLPAMGLAPFWLVHYPLAFILGVAGIVVIGGVGNRSSKNTKQVKNITTLAKELDP